MRRFCWPLILFQFIWLNIVVPGHTRGIVTIGGSCAGQSCPENSAACCTNKPHDSTPKSPTRDQQKRCAICAFAAALSTPPTYNYSLDFLGVGRSIALSAPTSPSIPDLSGGNRERAPPTGRV